VGRQRLLVMAVLTVCSLALAACSFGPVGIGIPVNGTSSTRWAPNVIVNGCAPSAGHVKIEFDSTAGANPERVTYLAFEDESPPPVLLDGPVGSHFEATDGVDFRTGQCFRVVLAPSCPTSCPAWTASLQTFNYRVSFVPDPPA
jgi:hypothetical protein